MSLSRQSRGVVICHLSIAPTRLNQPQQSAVAPDIPQPAVVSSYCRHVKPAMFRIVSWYNNNNAVPCCNRSTGDHTMRLHNRGGCLRDSCTDAKTLDSCALLHHVQCAAACAASLSSSHTVTVLVVVTKKRKIADAAERTMQCNNPTLQQLQPFSCSHPVIIKPLVFVIIDIATQHVHSTQSSHAASCKRGVPMHVRCLRTAT